MAFLEQQAHRPMLLRVVSQNSAQQLQTTVSEPDPEVAVDSACELHTARLLLQSCLMSCRESECWKGSWCKVHFRKRVNKTSMREWAQRTQFKIVFDADTHYFVFALPLKEGKSVIITYLDSHAPLEPSKMFHWHSQLWEMNAVYALPKTPS